MQYSWGSFPTRSGELDAAQKQKMENICRKLSLQPGERLIDIGCSWGGLVRYAAQKYRVNVLGVTLSTNQKTYADEEIPLAELQGLVALN